jgi:outer membrane biosynthesis protein TonB
MSFPRNHQPDSTRATAATRRSRLAAGAGCALSLLVHGSSFAVLSLTGRTSNLAAPLDESLPQGLSAELVAISVTIEGMVREPAEPAEPSAEGPIIQPHLVSVRRRIGVREPAVPPLPEPPATAMVPEDDPAPPPPAPTTLSAPRNVPTPAPPAQMVPPEIARALRTYDFFPTMALKLVHGKGDANVRICVSEQGSVSEASIENDPDDAFAETLRAALLRWRYRPLTVNGRPTPFCHRIRLSYRTQVGS